MTARTDSPGTEQLRRLLDELDENRRVAVAVAAELGPTRLRWRPEPDAWSVAECLDHLVRTGEAYLTEIDRQLERARGEGLRADGPFSRGFLGRWLVRGMEPPPGFRVPSPAAFRPSVEDAAAERVEGEVETPDGAEASAQEKPEDPSALARFLEHQDRLARRVRRADGLDLEALSVPYPVLPLLRINLMAGFAYLAAHQRRHLWQARRVVGREEFPEDRG